MKAVILAGGYGTRLSEETGVKPKPMVDIGEYPILWHIMKLYHAHGVNEFVICCGYKGHVIKQYFADYALNHSSVTFDLANNSIERHSNGCEPWKVTLVDTGEGTMTGGRLKRVRDFVGDETFFFTYGDGVSNVDLTQLLAYHRSKGTLATLTAVQPQGRFGVFILDDEDDKVDHFREKPIGGGENAWINGGFFVLEPQVIDYIEGDDTVWERDPMEQLAREGQLSAFRHDGFWHAMDTLRDRMVLEGIWESGEAPWRVWK
jgi:glucose-1-phosphate cytidylyltransferase